jgi:hypothetical protein
MDSEIDEEFHLIGASSMLGELVSFDIPLKKRQRNVWLALDVFSQLNLATWNTEGELRFTKFNGPVLTVPIRRGTNPLVTTGGPIFTTPARGGLQPGLSVGNPWATGAAQTYVEIPCWTFEVEADQVKLFVKAVIDNGSSNFVAGLRIQSQ